MLDIHDIRQESDPETEPQLPSNQLILPVVPIREGVLFPSTESVLTFGRKISVNAIAEAAKNQNLVVLLTQKNPETDFPQQKDLYEIGTLAIIDRTLKTDDRVNALVRGIGRVEVARFLELKPVMKAQVIKLTDFVERDEEMRALTSHLQKQFRKAIHMGKPVEFLNFMKLMSGVTEGELVDQIASTLTVKTAEKQEVLDTIDVKQRLKLVIQHLTREMKVLEIEKDVVHKTQEKFDKSMRENVLRERLRTIQKELGDLEDEEELAENYSAQLKKLKLPEEIAKKIDKEIKRLRSMSPNNPETGYVRSWLDVVFDIPWKKYNKSDITLAEAEKILDTSHYSLEEVKDRVLEYLAVLKLKQQALKDKKETATVPTILCFVGPPGVGKTSIGRSIAEALNRKFTKVSLGGIRDEAEIRGHRRTYVGAMPGRIVNGIIQADSMNPVFMLDEVDKIGTDFRGDPSAALLEALDPEQNKAFEDHYLDMPLDLSQVIFITTANTLDTIPPALRDRLEIIRYSGYTEEEKFHIAKDHLFNKQLEANGLTPEQLQMPDESIHFMIKRYTREAGVRDLERTIGKSLRKTARTIAEHQIDGDTEKTKLLKLPITLTEPKIKEYLGPEKFDIGLTEVEDRIGLATGLAWTSVGGEVLFIEVALTPGKGTVKLTGKLGEVMKESAQTALTYVKANLTKLGISIETFDKTDVHVHIPEGATPKEGPSAGVTMATAIISAFTNIPVNRQVAMTGEVTLRGNVLRIGGLKEKSIAAHRAGSKTIIIPKENDRDLVEIPETVKKDIVFKPVATMDEVLEIALTKKLKPLTAKKAKAATR
jgi:ATP-dependent Lon protease